MTTTPTSPAGAHATLRRLAMPHALHFGSRLLHRGNGGIITFREFVAVARELVDQRPEQTAVYLAALVALDMQTEDSAPVPVRAPSPN